MASTAIITRPARLALPALTTDQRVAMRALPAEIVAGLRILRDELPPSTNDPAGWDQVALDAIRLAIDGWAGRALALGWSAHDLFGIGATDAADFAGLAVWLRGRRLMLLDRDTAVVDHGDRRSFFNRGGLGHGRDAERSPVLLWEFGR